MTIVGFTHVNIGSDAVNSIIDGIDTVVLDTLIWVGAVGALVGAVQKIYLTLTGNNPVVTPQ
jgi:hypothetical protein